MKEYINRLARGNVRYELPQLVLTTERIEEQVMSGTKTIHSFGIGGTELVRGIIYSDSERVLLSDAEFCGKENQITYTINTCGCAAGDSIEGRFQVVSNAGEAEISYVFQVAEPVCATSNGNAADLFAFASLVEHSPKEAGELFVSDEFASVFLKNDVALRNLYELIREEKDIQLAMEEFLIAAHKKEPVTLTISEQNKEFPNLCEDQKEILTIERSGWGEITITVESDCDFVKLEKHSLTQDDFTGNRYELEYVVQKDRMHRGNNYGRIKLTTKQQSLSLDIQASSGGMQQLNREHRNAMVRLTKEYLNFRMKRVDLSQWIEHSNQILNRIRGIEQDNVYFKLVQAQMYFTQQRAEDGQWLLDNVKNDIFDHIDDHVELYCYYLYVNSLAIRSEEYTTEVVKIITRYFENGHDDYRILWLLFYLDAGQYKNRSIKLARIKDSFRVGCSSPIMYMEALSVMNTQPVLLRVLNPFEYQVILFGCKNHMITKDLALQICQLIGNEKIANVKYLSILETLYGMYDEDEILSVLVTHRIRNELVGQEYLPLYEKGILRGLRITRLYEYYMMSLDHHDMKRLPKMVLMYFVYESELEFHTKAYLYANVITNREVIPEVMQSYSMQIERFAYEQIRQGHIDPCLEIIYRYIWSIQMVSAETAEFMCRYLFTYRVTCFDSNIIQIFVKHKELLHSVSYPVIDRIAYIPIYTEGAAITFEYQDGTIRRGTVQYELERLHEDATTLETLKEYRMNDLLLGLNFFETSLKSGQKDEVTAKNCLDIMKNDQVTDEVKRKMNSWLIAYYYGFYTGNQFEERYHDLTISGLDEKDAVALIETCITNAMYEDAYDLAGQYGYQKVQSERLFLLVKHLLLIATYHNEPLLLQMGAFVFQKGKYDKELLELLTEQFNGSNDQMYAVWKAACNYEVDVMPLTERLLAQALFTGEHNGRMTELFRYYNQRGGDPQITEAYAAYQCFHYFIQHKTANEIVFEVVEKNLLKNANGPDICKLALVKHYAEGHISQLSDNQLHLADQIIEEMCRQDKYFACFRKFGKILDLPYNIIDQTVVEYDTIPDSKVQIHYQFQNEKAEHTEVLKCIAGGAYTKSFTLFYGDSLQYYFTEETNGERKESEHLTLVSKDLNSDAALGRFGCLNDMMASREQHDVATLKKLMHEYCVNDYLSEQMFKPM